MPFAALFRARATKLALIILGGYVVVYAVLSALGGYQDNITALDRLGIITRGWPDRQEWQPVLITVAHFPGPGSAFRANVGGFVFMPLVVLDRQLCHATQPLP
jgi:hypothetical protein